MRANRFKARCLCGGAAAVVLTLQLAGCGAALTVGAITGLQESRRTGSEPNAQPAATVLSPVQGQEINDRIPIRYSLVDAEGDPVAMRLEYSVGGGGFLTASPLAEVNHDGEQDLLASPAGVEHTFVWNSGLDLGDVDLHDVRVRLQVNDGRGFTPSATSPTFRVLNRRISTFVGGEVSGDELIKPSGLWLDEQSGTLYVADDEASKVFAIELAARALTRVAGNEFRGPGASHVLATTTSLAAPTSVLVRGDRLYFGTTNLVRSVQLSTGFLTTEIGTGVQGSDGDGGPPTAAEIEDQVIGLSLDPQGNLYYAAEASLRVLNLQPTQITVGSTTIAPGTVNTVTTGGAEPEAWLRLRHDSTGNLYVLSKTQVWLLNTQAAPLVVYPLSAAPITVAPGALAPLIGNDGSTPAGPLATELELDLDECDVVVDLPARVAYLTTRAHAVLVVDLDTAQVQTLVGTGVGVNAGDGGLARQASIRTPLGLALSSEGLLFVACSTAVRVVNTSAAPQTLGDLQLPPGQIETVVQGAAGASLLAVDAVALALDGSVFTANSTSGALLQISPDTRQRVTVVGPGGVYAGDGGPAHLASSPDFKLALDPQGNAVFGSDGRIRFVNRQSTALTVAGVSIPPGHVRTLAGNGVQTSSGDGGPASAATLVGPEAVFVDASGVILFSEDVRLRALNTTSQERIVAGVRVGPGSVETIAGTGAEGGSGDGGPPLLADCEPRGIERDAEGNIYFVDAALPGVRVINVTGSVLSLYSGAATVSVAPGTIQAIAGGGATLGDGLLALDTEFGEPSSLLILSGELLLCDVGDRRLRRIDLQSGLVSTIVGIGLAGFNGDAIPNEHARVEPEVVAADAAGRLFILDRSGRVRRLLR